MNSYPQFVEVKGKRYSINSDFRIAIKCIEIADDDTIGDYERVLAIIYILFGEEALNDIENHNELLELALLFLNCGEELNETADKPDMDFIEDEKYIKSSFKYDYQYNPYDMEYLHWYEYYNDLNNLSTSEFGNCCILNRIRDIRNYDTSKIRDKKEKERIEKAKKRYELKKNRKKTLTKEQERSIENLIKIAKL